ncbi:MAG: hypothetical protein E7179_05050 [Erysipelotrichaceae bacterium]|jgi:hypothetical protein|nr:hypothetical protein [Erysipelotrichaceae bacterium]
MKIKKSLWAVLPAAALAFGAVAMALMPKGGDAIEANAIDYSRAKRSMTENEGTVTATLNVSNYSGIDDMKGWLLCLLSEKPIINAETRKIEGSADRHPNRDTACKHYFFAESTAKTDGTVTITWDANACDQKETWTATETAGEAGNTLKDWLEKDDWYLAIGPRQVNEWDGPDIGAGLDYIWENIDYYVGLESNVFNGVIGETYLDITQCSDWENDNAKFAFYYYNATANGWSDFAVEMKGQDNIYLASYELEFTPTNVIAVRLDKDATVPDMEKKWNQTQNLTYYPSGAVEITGWEQNDSNSSPLAIVEGLGEEVLLDNYKRNFAGHPEHYNEEVALKAGDEFEIKLGDTSYHTFSTDDTVKDAFALNESKIHVNKAGTYAFYFDATSHSLYITDPILAAADVWAQAFLGENCAYTKKNWETMGGAYGDLPDKSKLLFREAPHTEPGAQLVGFIALAVERYDLLLTQYGTGTYDDFMDRLDAGKLTLPQSTPNALFLNGDNRSTTILLVLAGVAAATLTGAIVYAKKRKNRA